MAEGKETRPIYEVIFVYDTKTGTGKDKKTEEKILGPIHIHAKTELMAVLRAGLQNSTELLKADILSIEVKAKRF